MDTALKQELIDCLADFVSDHKKQRIEQVLAGRTRHLTIVLEDVFQPHNASAVLRSCECFGVQDVHIIEDRNAYIVNPDVVQGASKWLDLVRYSGEEGNAQTCFAALRARGYRLVAATPHRDECPLDELAVEGRLALMFGTEEQGLSDYALEQADEYVKVPMYGFTESFNISVCAALILREITHRMRTAAVEWQLSEEEKRDLCLNWYRKIVRGSALIEERFLAARDAVPDSAGGGR
jgi:tRNA (guanosine-2'-O-)-methyltransferase